MKPSEKFGICQKTKYKKRITQCIFFEGQDPVCIRCIKKWMDKNTWNKNDVRKAIRMWIKENKKYKCSANGAVVEEFKYLLKALNKL